MKHKESPYNPTKEKVTRVIDATKHNGLVYAHQDINMPGWLDAENLPDAKGLTVFRNGVLDTQAYMNGEVNLIPPTPRLFTTTFCDYNFDLNALPYAQPFLDTLNAIFNGDAECIRLLQQWFGYNMIPDTSLEKFMLMVGKPGAGKGTILQVFRSVVGVRNVVDSSLSDLGGPFGVGSLLGKLACIMADAHLPSLEASGRALEVIKTVSGRDPIMVNQKHRTPFPIELTARFTIAVNELPAIHDSAAALRRRLLLLSFPNSFRGREDTSLKARLSQPKVTQGVAIWALQGLADLRASGCFITPKSSECQTKAFEAKTSPIRFFVEHCLEFDPQASTKKDDVRAAYDNACQLMGLRQMNSAEFGRAFASACQEVSSSKPGGRGQQIPHYVGVRVKPRSEWTYP